MPRPRPRPRPSPSQRHLCRFLPRLLPTYGYGYARPTTSHTVSNPVLSPPTPFYLRPVTFHPLPPPSCHPHPASVVSQDPASRLRVLPCRAVGTGLPSASHPVLPPSCLPSPRPTPVLSPLTPSYSRPVTGSSHTTTSLAVSSCRSRAAVGLSPSTRASLSHSAPPSARSSR